jgi:hypothetical protein
MKVLLIDVDSKIPNLALMKLSAWYKSQDHITGLDVVKPDLIYASIVFSKNRWKASSIPYLYPNTPLRFGGSGYSLEAKLAPEIEKIKPDYDLYPSTYSQGFTTRGCDRHCPYCIVPEKEGRLVRWQHPSNFHDDRFDTMMVMDNNWLMDKEWFLETSQWILDNDLAILEHGMDIRCLDEERANRLSELKFRKGIHFAFDFLALESTVRGKCKILDAYGLLDHSLRFYVYTDSDRDFDSALKRCNILKELGVSPFIMFNQANPKTKRIRRLIHWANRLELFWSCDFEKYLQSFGEASLSKEGLCGTFSKVYNGRK